MKSLYLALLAGLTLSAGSGCCLLDHCLGHHCGHGGGCDECSGQACSYCGPHCGACGCCGGDCSCPPGDCGPGGCANCKGGAPVEGYAEEAPAMNARGKVMPAKMSPARQARRPVMPVSHEEAAASQGAAMQAGYGHQEFNPQCQACLQCRAPCGHCGNCSPCPNCCDGHRAVADQLGGPAGPPCGQVTYPYYTTRGPRDFLLNNPPGIGPGPGPRPF